MIENCIKDLHLEVSKMVSDERYNKGRVYWSGLFDHRVSCIKYGIWMYIKLPSPKLAGYGFADSYRMEKYNENEIKRVRGIWQEFVRIFKEKMEKVDTGQSLAVQEFKDGILLENGKYGLKCGKGWPLRDE